MAEPTPPDWCDRCRHCEREFAPGETRWLEQRAYLVHTECAQWHLWETPPYVWALDDLRRRYRAADELERSSIADAGTLIRSMERAWPNDAAAYVSRVVAALRRIAV